MTLVVETITPPEMGQVDIELKLSANIQISAATARRIVSCYVTHHVGDLLHGDVPNLVWSEQGVVWRVPVVLSAPSKGRIGAVGALDVDVQTGELIVSDNLIHTIETEANRLAINAAL